MVALQPTASYRCPSGGGDAAAAGKRETTTTKRESERARQKKNRRPLLPPSAPFSCLRSLRADGAPPKHRNTETENHHRNNSRTGHAITLRGLPRHLNSRRKAFSSSRRTLIRFYRSQLVRLVASRQSALTTLSLSRSPSLCPQACHCAREASSHGARWLDVVSRIPNAGGAR